MEQNYRDVLKQVCLEVIQNPAIKSPEEKATEIVEGYARRIEAGTPRTKSRRPRIRYLNTPPTG